MSPRGRFWGVHFWARRNAFNSLGAFFCPSAQIWFPPSADPSRPCSRPFGVAAPDERGREPGKKDWRIARDSNSLNITS
jgi:hypothetical protein